MMDHPFDPDLSSYPPPDTAESHFSTSAATNIQPGTPTISTMTVQRHTPTTSAMAIQTTSQQSPGMSAHPDTKHGIQNAMIDSKTPFMQSGMQASGLRTSYPISQMQPMQANPRAIIIPTHMTSYGTSVNDSLPHQHELYHARAQAHHIYKEYHPDGGEVTHDATRASFFQNFDLDKIPKSADLSMIDDDVATHFPDALTAEFYRVAARTRKPADQQDRTIPTTAQALRAHVKTLIHAFNSWKHADDNPGMLNPFKKQVHDQKLVEATCWSLLKACIDRSQSRLPLLFAWDESKSRESHGHETFAKRFDAMVLAMFQSKTICKHLFDAPYSNIFVDDPTRAQGRVKANRDLNKQKAQHMSAGKRLAEEEARNNGTYKAPKRPKRSRETTMTSESSEPAALRSPINDPLNYLGDSSSNYPDPPLTPTAQEGARRSTRQTQHPTCYADYSPGQSTPGAYDSPVQDNDAIDDGQAEELKAEGNVLITGRSQSVFGNPMPGQFPFYQQQMQQQPFPYQGYTVAPMYYGTPVGAGSGPQPSMMAPQDFVPSSSINQQSANQHQSSAYNSSFNRFGSHQNKDKFGPPDNGTSN